MQTLRILAACMLMSVGCGGMAAPGEEDQYDAGAADAGGTAGQQAVAGSGGTAGAAGSGGTAGAAGAPVDARPPAPDLRPASGFRVYGGCKAEADYVIADLSQSQAHVTNHDPNTDILAWKPRCLKVRMGVSVVVHDQTNHPYSILPGSGSGVQPVVGYDSVTLLFSGPGFYPYACGAHGEKGSIWVVTE